jgi:hypothetical protein
LREFFVLCLDGIENRADLGGVSFADLLLSRFNLVDFDPYQNYHAGNAQTQGHPD